MQTKFIGFDVHCVECIQLYYFICTLKVKLPVIETDRIQNSHINFSFFDNV